MNEIDLTALMTPEETVEKPVRPRRVYDKSSDPAAIANLARLQANRPLKPPGK